MSWSKLFYKLLQCWLTETFTMGSTKHTENGLLFHKSYRPLPIEGKAMLDKFSSSASIKQFLTVLSSNCIASFVFQVGPLQWMTNLAGKLWPGQMAAI